MPKHFIFKGLKWPVSNGITVSAEMTVPKPCQAGAGDTEHIMVDKPNFWPSTPGTQTVVDVVSIRAAWWRLCPLPPHPASMLCSLCQQGEGTSLPTYPDSWPHTGWKAVLLPEGVVGERGS